ncbi:MAG: uracil-DNA glycosylase [Pseudomonadota bacterium]
MEREEWEAQRTALAWQVELGADEAMLDQPLNRFELAPQPQLAARAKEAHISAPTLAPSPAERNPVEHARSLAQGAGSLSALKASMESYEHCGLKAGARQLVFADGTPGAQLMVIGEAPGRDEDRIGKPFVGRAGQLLDRMLAAIDRDRTRDVYITNIIPWRPPQNRDPSLEEIAMMLPFVERHVALAQPTVLIAMGNIACQALLGRKGVTRLRGTWTETWGLPVMPMFHPAYLLRQPAAKRHAWADLLEVRARLEGAQE